MATGGYDRTFWGYERVLVAPNWYHAGEDIIVTLEDLDGDHAASHAVSLLFSGTAYYRGSTFPYQRATSDTINDGFPLRLVIVDLEWDGYYAPFWDITDGSGFFRLTATCAAQATPTDRQQCDDWAAFGFTNRGECLRSVLGQGGAG
jgi:hypothetical protein